MMIWLRTVPDEGADPDAAVGGEEVHQPELGDDLVLLDVQPGNQIQVYLVLLLKMHPPPPPIAWSKKGI